MICTFIDLKNPNVCGSVFQVKQRKSQVDFPPADAVNFSYSMGLEL